MIFYHVESGITSSIDGDAHTLSCLNNGMTGLAYGVSLRVAHPFLVQKGDGHKGWRTGLIARMAETLSK